MLDPLSPLRDEDDAAESWGESVRRSSPRTLLAFALAVLFAQVALFGVSFGLLLVAIRGNVRIGGALAAIGLLSLGLTFAVYWWFREGD